MIREGEDLGLRFEAGWGSRTLGLPTAVISGVRAKHSHALNALCARCAEVGGVREPGGGRGVRTVGKPGLALAL